MSRIDDDREAARRAEKIMLQKREQEQRAKDKAGTDSAFAKLVNQGQQEKATAHKDQVGRSAIAQLLDSELAQGQAVRSQETEGRAHSASRQRGAQARGFAAQLNQSQDQVRRDEAGRAGASNEAQHVEEGVQTGVHASEDRAVSRKSDAKVLRENVESRKGEREELAVTSQGFSSAGEAEGMPQKGDGEGQGRKKDDSSNAQLAAGFRFNPALMAPVPVAKPKEGAGSERLRALATEIAQKIVERVRVGTNAAGKAEFQIDLRSNVLAGLSIKISGANGKIRAVFSGNDREVLKLLREQGDSLKKALTSRGLTLEEFKVEERT